MISNVHLYHPLLHKFRETPNAQKVNVPFVSALKDSLAFVIHCEGGATKFAKEPRSPQLSNIHGIPLGALT